MGDLVGGAASPPVLKTVGARGGGVSGSSAEGSTFFG
jgi:hypothetical protein